MSQSVARSEKILDRLAKETHLTEAAKQWLITVLDPFHDTPLNCTGVPDGQTGNSVTQTIKSSMTITAPTGLADGELWKCNVVMSPFFSAGANTLHFTTAYSKGNTSLIEISPNQGGYREVAPITVTKCRNDNTTNWLNPFGGLNNANSLQQFDKLDLNANYTGGDYRIISQGFEVLNTTNELNIQGLVTTYRVPVPAFSECSAVTTYQFKDGDLTKAAFAGSVDMLTVQAPPTTSQEALRLPNTKQWKAKEGCYVVAHLNDPETKINNNRFVMPYIDFDPYGPGDRKGSAVIPKELSALTIVNLDPPVPGWPEINWGNFDLSGAIFEGLTKETTLTVNWNVYIERFPSLNEPDLIVLAKPSPDFCPMAFELYKAISMELPVGVMQKENGLGDWFRDAVNTCSEIISPIAAMIPHPAAQMVGKVSSVVGNLTRRENSSPLIVSDKQEREFLREAVKPKAKTVKKEIKKEVKRDVKKAVMPQHKQKAKRK